ncbi:hypothetical protein SpCBS45565_g06299 [Spizellomyces sp. 'palustris']|nr:hypothetical protein SpCBS45565_g06299 [Spizellomyces sp. 'palustris']
MIAKTHPLHSHYRKFNLKVHQKVHTGQDFFTCQHPPCSRQFARRHDLIRHSRLHTNERPFVCTWCGAGWCRSDALKRHLRRCVENVHV